MSAEKPITFTFATICKNESHVIYKTLKSIEKIADYILVVDTGSTDSTVQIVQDFLKETGIPGEVHHVDWVSFGYNKTIMMELAYGKSDYVMTFDADDELMGDFYFNESDRGKDLYHMTMRRGTMSYLSTIIYDNRLRWKFCGVAHTYIKCLDKPNVSYGYLLDRGYLSVEDVGNRSTDPQKYLKDAEKLKAQFWETLVEDPDGLNTRSVFYTAQSYMDQGMYKEGLQWYRLYTNLKTTWIEEVFESHLRISVCMMLLNYNFDSIYSEIQKAIDIFADRAEPHFKIGKYCNEIGKFELAYKHLMIAKDLDLEAAKNKYVLFVNFKCYGKYALDELSVSCYWLGKFEEGIGYLGKVIYDDELSEMRPRLSENYKHFTRNIKEKESVKPIIEFFGSDYQGTFIDVGSGASIVRNESYYFECKGWQVYCIEPNFTSYDFSRQFRNRVYNFACGASNQESADFTICTLDNGNQEAITSLNIDERLVADHESFMPKFEKTKVVVRTLNNFLEAEEIQSIDILKIDTEGTELDVLVGLDLNKYSPRLIIVENNYEDRVVETYLRNFDYVKFNRISVNDFYKHI